MPPFSETFDPVALTDQVVRLQPEDSLRRVQAVEQLANFDPIDVVSEISGSSIAAAETTDPTTLDQFEMNQNSVGQFRIDVLSNMKVQVRQPKAQDRRFHTAGVGPTVLTPATAPNKTALFVLGAGDPQVVVENPNNYPLTRALINVSGFKLILTPEELSEGEVDSQPVSFPTHTLSRYTQRSGGSNGAASAAASQPRGGRR